MRPSEAFALGVALSSSLLHEGALRLLSVPAELYIVWLLARSRGDLQERLRSVLGDAASLRARSRRGATIPLASLAAIERPNGAVAARRELADRKRVFHAGVLARR